MIPTEETSTATSPSALIRFMPLAVSLLLLLFAHPAMAHPGHTGSVHDGFLAGLFHPLLGVDHLLAMLAIGIWSLRQPGLLGSVTPILAVAGMLLGAGMAWGGASLPGVEFGIAISVVLAGLLITALLTLPGLLGAALVVLFMLFHGHAHGSEMPPGASLLFYPAGFVLATLAITQAGRQLGNWLSPPSSGLLLRSLGVAISTAGALLVIG
ncbi:HupE/UreJ family protein [Halomonas faecis]|uniref:HupE/UreJ family protein n=1 Tax=Halomonas faecis TaxID=1562110 RepID=UPI001969B668|nr:HupE/UreJ family protein [Halomonas faecis]